MRAVLAITKRRNTTGVGLVAEADPGRTFVANRTKSIASSMWYGDAANMIQEYSHRIYSAAVVGLWVVVVLATCAVVWAGTVNGGISW